MSRKILKKEGKFEGKIKTIVPYILHWTTFSMNDGRFNSHFKFLVLFGVIYIGFQPNYDDVKKDTSLD